MKNIKLRFHLSGVIPFLLLSACTLPSQISSPVPVANPGQAETSIAGTAQAAAKQTEQVDLATPTLTTVPTETLTPTPKVSLYGTSLIIGEDQSTLFIDHKAGVQLTIPAGWMAVRVNEDEYYKAFATAPVLGNPEIYNRLNQIQSHDVNFFRLDAIDVREGHIFNGLISDISVIFQADDLRTLQEWEKAERQRVSPYSGFKFISSSYQETASGMPVFVIEESWDWTSGGKLYYRGVFFSTPTGTIVLDFQTSMEFNDATLPDFEQVVNSVTLLNP